MIHNLHPATQPWLHKQQDFRRYGGSKQRAHLDGCAEIVSLIPISSPQCKLGNAACQKTIAENKQGLTKVTEHEGFAVLRQEPTITKINSVWVCLGFFLSSLQIVNIIKSLIPQVSLLSEVRLCKFKPQWLRGKTQPSFLCLVNGKHIQQLCHIG